MEEVSQICYYLLLKILKHHKPQPINILQTKNILINFMLQQEFSALRCRYRHLFRLLPRLEW